MDIYMNFKTASLLIAATIMVTGCSTTEQKNEFDNSLYAGKPIDSLTNQEPPKTEKEAIMRGDAAISSQNYDLALYEYIRSLSLSDAVNQSKTLYNIARIHTNKENMSLAERSYKKSIDFDPNNVQSLEALGLIYTKQGLVTEGRDEFFKAINADQVRLNSSSILTSYSEVTEDTLKGLAYDSNSPFRSYMGLGILADVDKKHDIAKRYYERALEINPSSNQALVNLGYSHYMSGGYYLAQRITNRALKKEPENERALNNLALIYIALGDNRQALNIFQRNMTTPEALNNVGYFIMLRGKPDLAVPYFEQAIDKSPFYYKIANENLVRALSEVRVNKGELKPDTFN
jgi:Flp pilus assembly protein TadD